MRDVFEEGALISFQGLVETYNIPPAHFLKYKAVTTVLNEYWTHGHMEPPTSLVLHAILSQGMARRTISALYVAILSSHPVSHAKLWGHWYADLGMCLKDSQWTQANQ